MRQGLERLGLVFFGCFISAVAYATTIRADLGLGPLYAVQEGVSEHLDISIGRSVWIVGGLLCVVSALMRKMPGPATIALPFIMGTQLDLVLPHTPGIDGLWLRVTVVFVATWVMALGGAIVIRARTGAAAPDLVMLALSERTGHNNRNVRLAMEAVFIALGWLLGGTIGVGTVLTGVLIGPALHFWIERLHSESPERDHVVV